MGILHYLILFFIISCANLKMNACLEILGRKEGEKFNARNDANTLHKAVTGIGTDSRVIMEVITSRTPTEINAIELAYNELHQKDLRQDLKGDLSGTFKDIIFALMEQPNNFSAKELEKAFKGIFSVDTNCINQILCTKEVSELNLIMKHYQDIFKKPLLDTIEEKLSGDYKTFIKGLLTPPIRDYGKVNRPGIAAQLKSFPDPGSNKSYDCSVDNNPTLMELMAKENYEQVRHVVHEYEATHESTEKVLETYCKKPLEDAYITVVQFAKNPSLYYARLLNKAMAGIGTDEKTLIRVLVSQRKNINDIKKDYYLVYKTPLATSILAETSGFFKETLLKIVGYNTPY